METIALEEQKAILSTEVAEMIGKEHKELLRDIRRYTDQMDESNIAPVDFFYDSVYVDAKGEDRPCFFVTEKGCEFIAHKMTGIKGTVFTAKYIDRFHALKQESQFPRTTAGQIRLLAQGNVELEQKIDAVNDDFQNFKTDLPMLPAEIEEVTRAAKRRGLRVLGGKLSNAYSDRSLVTKVYKDIYSQIHREYGVESFKSIKRREKETVIKLINSYELPLVLKEEIESKNK